MTFVDGRDAGQPALVEPPTSEGGGVFGCGLTGGAKTASGQGDIPRRPETPEPGVLRISQGRKGEGLMQPA